MVNTPPPVTEPTGVVMTTSFAPAESEGTVQVSEVPDATETFVALTPPIVTVVDPDTKLVPPIVTVAPDPALVGEIAV